MPNERIILKVKYLEGTTVTYYEVRCSNLTFLGKIRNRDIVVTKTDIRGQADNQIDIP